MTEVPEFRGNTPRALTELASWTALRTEEALEPELPIVDPHHHLWDDERGGYVADDFLAELASGHNIVSTVYLQHRAMYRADGPERLRPVGEVEFANGIAAASASGRYGPIRLCEGIVGHADLLLGDGVQEVLEAMVAAGGGRFRGIRHGATWDAGSAGYGRSFAPRHLLLDERFRRGFARLLPLGLSFDAWLFFPQLPELADLLKAFPETRVILDHGGGLLGIPPYVDRAEAFKTWRASIRMLAAFPNLSVKLGGLGMLYGGWGFHLRPLPPSSQDLAAAWKPYIETCIETFGPERCMFESNFPVDKQSCGYGVLWNAFKRLTREFSASEKAALYHDTAARAYRLPRALQS
ncbi:MAG TPA: amidohydrolase family protein [Ramlibacter sp.]|nr:amidohydrolase family protein [Ramlibacter sp.]